MRGGKIKVIKLYSIGEPLLNPDISEMVRIIKEADICETLEITSNASLLSKRTAEALVDNGLDVFRASIYSVEEKKNREITQSTVSVEEIKENIRYMREYRDSIGKTAPFISAKMIDSYSSENEKFRHMYASIADEAYIDKLMETDLGAGEDSVEKYYSSNAGEAKVDIKTSRIYHAHKACRYPFTHMTVKSDGKIAVCCSDWQRMTIVGDANADTLEEIWNSKELYEFRCMTLKTKGLGNALCAKCVLPLRDFPEDDIDDFPLEKLNYNK